MLCCMICKNRGVSINPAPRIIFFKGEGLGSPFRKINHDNISVRPLLLYKKRSTFELIQGILFSVIDF